MEACPRCRSIDITVLELDGTEERFCRSCGHGGDSIRWTWVPVPRSDPRELDLLAEIYAAPDDDAPRRVYADWLLERGDPRGDFIVFQLRGPRYAREDLLLEAQITCERHWRDWIGAPASALLPSAVGFARGMWSYCDTRVLLALPPERRRALMTAPAWATVQSIVLPADADDLAGLVRRAREVLWAAGGEPPAELPEMPALESLTVHCSYAQALAWIRLAPCARLELHVSPDVEEAARDLLDEAERGRIAEIALVTRRFDPPVYRRAGDRFARVPRPEMRMSRLGLQPRR